MFNTKVCSSFDSKECPLSNKLINAWFVLLMLMLSLSAIGLGAINIYCLLTICVGHHNKKWVGVSSSCLQELQVGTSTMWC